jgi:hypothetical protein
MLEDILIPGTLQGAFINFEAHIRNTIQFPGCPLGAYLEVAGG